MTTTIPRPSLGVIVEGTSEYVSYRSLIAKNVPGQCPYVPLINAGGCTAILAKLEQHLDRLARAWGPTSILITCDSRDFRGHPVFRRCTALRTHIQERAHQWLTAAQVTLRDRTPSSIGVVIQHQTFESWLIADLAALVNSGLIRGSALPLGAWIANVDEEVENPPKWLGARLKNQFRVKDPTVSLKLVREMDPTRACQASRSFKKFWKEVSTAMSAV